MNRCGIRGSVLLLSVILGVLPNGLLYADLGDFSKSVKEGQRKEREEDDEEQEERESWDEDDEGGFWDTLFLFTGLLWYYHNRSAWYTDYPYENGPSRPAAIGHDERLLFEDFAPERKRSRWTFSSAGGIFFEGGDRGATANIRLNGTVGGLFGPNLEYRLWKDASATLHLYRTGAALPLVQSDYFSLALDLSGVFVRGAVYVDGAAVGGTLATYPFRPLSLEVRGGGIFSETAGFSELGVRLGFHMSRFEAYAGYYGLFYDDTGLANTTTGLQSVEFGAAVHF